MKIDDTKKCRLCLKLLGNECSIDLFTEQKIVKLLSDLTGLSFENSSEQEELPQKICKKCCSTINFIESFKAMCITSNETFQGTLEFNKSKNVDVFAINSSEIAEAGITSSEKMTLLKRLIGDEVEHDSNARKNDVLNQELWTEIFYEQNSDDNGQADTLEEDTRRSLRIKNKSQFKENRDTKAEFNKIIEETDEKSSEMIEVFQYIERDNIQTDELTIDDIESSGVIADNKSEMKYHKKQNSKTTTCEICGKSFLLSRINYHVNSHRNIRPYKCNLKDCVKAFPSPYLLKSHQKFFHTQNYRYNCDVCSKRFKVHTSFVIHRSYHFDPKIPCSVCGKLLRHQRALKKHMMSHTGERPFLCKICMKTFQTRYTLRIHQRTHTQEKNYRCDICGKSYSHKCVLKTHILRMHAEINTMQK